MSQRRAVFVVTEEEEFKGRGLFALYGERQGVEVGTRYLGALLGEGPYSFHPVPQSKDIRWKRQGG